MSTSSPPRWATFGKGPYSSKPIRRLRYRMLLLLLKTSERMTWMPSSKSC